MSYQSRAILARIMSSEERFNKDFRSRLRQARDNADLKQEYVALKIGYETKNGYGSIERGETQPSPWQISVFLSLFQISANWLFGLPEKIDDLSEDEQRVLSMYRRIKAISPQAASIVMRQVQAALPEGE